MSLILDASVAAKWFNFEELSERATEFMQAFVEGDVELAAPIHIIYEVGNSIWKNPQLTDEDASDAIASLARLSLELLQPTIKRNTRIMEIARTKRTTSYDAAYVQAAEELKGRFSQPIKHRLPRQKALPRQFILKMQNCDMWDSGNTRTTIPANLTNSY